MNEQAEREELVFTAFSYLKKLMAGMDDIIEHVEERPGETLRVFADAMEGMRWTASAVRLTAPLHGLEPDEDQVMGQCMEITGAVQNADYRYLAELLANETMPMLCDWFDALEEAAEKLSGE